MTPSPVTIFVLWHPKGGEVGRHLASHLFNWFRLPDGDGIPVLFRSVGPPGRQQERPLDLPNSGDGEQWIVALVDHHMVADAVWREWLDRLAPQTHTSRRKLFPVALDQTAHNVPQSVRRLNFIRTDAVPEGKALTPEERAELIKPRLLKDLTEAFCRVLTTRPGRRGSDAKIRVFLSHAKADSVVEARALREHIYRDTQVSAFFDENDIALGYDFAAVLEESLNHQETAALIVLHSDEYATRPWCRREILAFRRPRRAGRPDSDIWLMNPMLVVQTMRGPKLSRTIAELGTLPCLRWEPGREPLILTTLLREVLLGAFHLRLARRIPPAPGRAIINWSPDIPSVRLLQIARNNKPKRLREIVYPHHSLSRLELDALKVFFPDLSFRAFAESALS